MNHHPLLLSALEFFVFVVAVGLVGLFLFGFKEFPRKLTEVSLLLLAEFRDFFYAHFYHFHCTEASILGGYC